MGFVSMNGRLILSDIILSMAGGSVYFLLWVLTSETAKLTKRFIFLFLLIFLVREFLVNKKHLEIDTLSVVSWVFPHLFGFLLGTLIVALLGKFGAVMHRKYIALSRPIAFQPFHFIPKSKLQQGVRSGLVATLYFPLLFFASWLTFGDLLFALTAQFLLTLIILALLCGARKLGASVWALHRPPIWSIVESVLLILYFGVLVAIVTLRGVEAKAEIFILMILLPRALFSSLVSCAKIAVSVWYPRGAIY